ncbi:hypothetical protein M3Y95_00357500 [Aphelenchoides besseyi]|nr:hypothetical protein M3Y95_00357500 [Aphelenchoides besseyi]
MDLRLLLFAVMMFGGNILVRGDEGCLKQQENDLEIDGGACTELQSTAIKIKQKQLSFQFRYDSTTELSPKQITLEVGGCTVNGDVSYGYSPGYFKHDELGNPNLPVTLQATEDKITSGQRSLPDCKPTFTSEGDHFTIKVAYKPEHDEIPAFKIIFKDSELTGKVETAGDWSKKDWRLWVLIAVIVLIVAFFALSIVGGVLWYKQLKNKLAPIKAPLMPSHDTSTAKSTTMPKSKNEANDEKNANFSKWLKENPRIKTWRWPIGTYKPEDIEFLRKTLEGPNNQLTLEMMLRQDPLNEQSMKALLEWRKLLMVMARGYYSNVEYFRIDADFKLIKKVLDTHEAIRQQDQRV